MNVKHFVKRGVEMRTLSYLLCFAIMLGSASALAQPLKLPRTTTIASGGPLLSSGLDRNGHLSVAFFDGGGELLKLWVDDGLGGGNPDDGLTNGSEVRTIETGRAMSCSLGRDSEGNLAVAYYLYGASQLRVWVDDGAGGGIQGDGAVNGSETRVITTGASYYGSIGVDGNGRLAVSYFVVGGADLYLWVDDGAGGGTAGDVQANGSEIRAIDTASGVGRYVSLATDRRGYLAISYVDYMTDDLKVWIDDGNSGGTAGDGVANGAEIRVIDSAATVDYGTSLGLDVNGHLAVSYCDDLSIHLKLWVDDGAVGGTADDGIANGGEVRVIDATDGVGHKSSLSLDGYGRLAVSYYDTYNYDAKVWIDDGLGGGIAGDGFANGSEIRTFDSNGDVGGASSISRDRFGNLFISYRDDGSNTVKLARIPSYETRNIDSTHQTGSDLSLGQDSEGRLAISYYDLTDTALVLWRDDGRGGGVAADGVANGSEVRTIDNSGQVGQFTSLGLTVSGNQAVSYFDADNGHLKLWVDDGAGGGIAGDGLG